MKIIKMMLLWALVLLATTVQAQESNRQLASQIRHDKTLNEIKTMALNLLSKGFNAGSGYSEVWCRDMNTFIEASLDTVPAKDVRGALLVFFQMQQPNGEIVDGYVTKNTMHKGEVYPFSSKLSPDHVGYKNSVETDQETSTIQALYKYILKTGDTAILKEKVGEYTVAERAQRMIDYLTANRYNEKYGLIYGATTADWGDIQPAADDVVHYNEETVRSIDIYDNAMLIIALNDMEEMGIARQSDLKLRADIAKNVRKYLWDAKNQKFRAHIYLDKSPVPADFDEDKVYYHGGTTIAIEAGLLSRAEIAAANGAMLRDVELSGMPSIGLTLYPTYPDEYFRSSLMHPYCYQNGGDWTWFGGRMIQQLVRYGYVAEAYAEIRPMIDRVLKNKGFFEWYGQGNVPSGSGAFKGSAGVLYKAICMLQAWSKLHE